MKLHLHGEPCDPGDEHGPLGPTHIATVEIEFGFEAIQWVEDLAPFGIDHVDMIECPELRKTWKKNMETGVFEEQKVWS
jgi:hypothetical protein